MIEKEGRIASVVHALPSGARSMNRVIVLGKDSDDALLNFRLKADVGQAGS